MAQNNQLPVSGIVRRNNQPCLIYSCRPTYDAFRNRRIDEYGLIYHNGWMSLLRKTRAPQLITALFISDELRWLFSRKTRSEGITSPRIHTKNSTPITFPLPFTLGNGVIDEARKKISRARTRTKPLPSLVKLTHLKI